MGGAFAAGCIPSGRLLTRALTGESLDEIGDGKPGSSNVARSVGWKSGAAVLALDAGKAYVPATAARLTGAGDGAVAAIGISTMPVSYTHLRAHETRHDLVCRLLLEKKK